MAARKTLTLRSAILLALGAASLFSVSKSYASGFYNLGGFWKKVSAAVGGGGGPAAYLVQGNFNQPQAASLTSITVKFLGAQTAGNLNIISVGGSTTIPNTNVTSVTDS